ncbi:hypothetical protein DCAR_0101255 [Daucus carota subsp. sativus]|uniref:Reverse transcriptase zinc-binding domain-containing protein n=1 Tax=Daucus carota subsp. sativus TaxID=79200 RepID=A0AAF1AF80_DAUCS|nr:hypothetical protein DCAR_0101255 [Daucus carota subsp. sativus]
MVTEGGQWDSDIVEDLFNARDKQCILNTMVRGDREEDVLYWNEDLTGDYTVKSAYQMLQRQKGLWSTADNSTLWKVIWSVKAPPKVLNMVWRALSNSLPTREVLAAKRVPVTLICPFCTGNGESIFHVLVQCPFADQCWRKRGRGYQPLAEVSFDRWLQRMLEGAGKDDHGDILTLCWSIWQARNKLVWNQTSLSVNQVVFSARQFLAEWKGAQVMSTKTLYRDVNSRDGVCSWAKPNQNEVKISVDAALFAECSKFGIGLLARDSDGRVVQGRSELFDGQVRSELAEAVAVKEALSWVKDKQ